MTHPTGVSLGWVAHLIAIENQARATCERHSETLEAALTKYDTYCQVLEDDADLLMKFHTLLWHPIQLVSPLVSEEERKKNEILIAAALYRHMEEARELLRRQLNGARLFQVGMIVGELCLTLRIREFESDRGRHAKLKKDQKNDQKWEHVRYWCRHQAFIHWHLEFGDDSVRELARRLTEHIGSRVKEFEVIKAPTQGQVERWIRPMRLIGPKKRGRPSKKRPVPIE